MIPLAEPQIARPVPASAGLADVTPTAPSSPGRRDGRYAPERGLIRRLRTAQANDGIKTLAERHKLDPETRDALAAELIKAGAPPITPATAEAALTRLVRFEPLNADALHPFLVLSADRALRARAVARIGDAMRSAGRSVRLLSDAVDVEGNSDLMNAGKRLGCGITTYDGSPDCVQILRRTDLACLSVIEAGFREPLDKIALLRLDTLVKVTGAEPVVVIRSTDAALALALSKIGVKRVILAETQAPISLGPVLSTLRKANLAVAEMLDVKSVTAPLRAGTPAALAALLTE